MPPVLFALAAAAGFFAAARLFAKAMDGHEGPRRQSDEQTGRPSAPSETARDLGQLEWDDSAGVYRPGPPQTS